MKNQEYKLCVISLEELFDVVKSSVRETIEDYIDKITKISEEEIMLRSEVAQLLRVTPDQVSEMCYRDELPGKKFGKGYRFLKSDVLKMLSLQDRQKR